MLWERKQCPVKSECAKAKRVCHVFSSETYKQQLGGKFRLFPLAFVYRSWFRISRHSAQHRFVAGLCSSRAPMVASRLSLNEQETPTHPAWLHLRLLPAGNQERPVEHCLSD